MQMARQKNVYDFYYLIGDSWPTPQGKLNDDLILDKIRTKRTNLD